LFLVEVLNELVILLTKLITEMNIYVANISWKSTEEELKKLFESYGEVTSVKVIVDKFTQRSRGFGFVEMADDTAARNAINELNGKDFNGRNLVVNEARAKSDSQNG